MRHTFAVKKYLETKDIFQVQRQLGHSSIDMTTNTYTVFNFGELERDFPELVNKELPQPEHQSKDQSTRPSKNKPDFAVPPFLQWETSDNIEWNPVQ